MTTAARARGFGNFNMNNTRDDNPAKGMGSFRPSTKGIWENAYQGSKRGSDNALPTGSGALIPDSQADTSAIAKKKIVTETNASDASACTYWWLPLFTLRERTLTIYYTNLRRIRMEPTLLAAS
ncbi:hypothetical protein HYQ44_017385 [Verticillium longisporum]|nr:hypothetical protein HYQ44_017385 [Verticillium longisporum]